MKVSVQPFWLPKAGNKEEEYEDAFWPREPVEEISGPFRLAVADGASTTSFSRLWAQLLVEAFGTGAINVSDLNAALPTLRNIWLATVGAKNLPWHAEEKVRRGAFSSLLGVYFEGEGEGRQGQWTRLAVGDSCLVQMRGEAVLLMFPLAHSEAFKANPYLVSSRPTPGPLSAEHVSVVKDVWESSDIFYLMTDALACWFIKEVEGGGKPWSFFERLGMNEEGAPFGKLVMGLRESNSIRNDDVTLLRAIVTA